MSRIQSAVAILLCFLMGSPVFGQTQGLTIETGHGFIYGLTRNYRARPVAEVSFADSLRVEKLMRAGAIYLSLRDAISLALENNLDIESVRYSPKLARADLLRASAGQLVRNVSSNISSGASSASANVQSSAAAVNNTGGSSGGSSGGGVLSGLNIQLAGSSIPNVEPTFYAQLGFNHTTQINASNYVSGTAALAASGKNLIYGLQQSFWTGTTVQLFTNSTFGYNQNAKTTQFNPVDTGVLNLSITQNLLNGFGLAVNKRAYHKAVNNLRTNDLAFKQQVIATVTNVVNLYWDLVTYNDELKVQQQTLRLDTQLYEDNKKRAELGAIAPIDTIQAEADMKAQQQNVITQESQLLRQEMILKSVLTRNGLNDPQVVAARIVPTDHIDVPEQDAVMPIQDLVAQAMKNRPEVEQNQIALENSRLDLLGVRNNLRPSLQAVVSLSNAGQAGTPIPENAGPYGINYYFAGGYGTVLNQVFSRNFPSYSASIALTIPIRNRANQADLVTSELGYRQSQIQDRQLQNNIKLNVLNAWTDMRNARAAYETSIVARKLQDETLAGMRRKYELGTTTILDVVLAQRDATARQLSEVDARNQYQRARTNLQQIEGKTLDTYEVDLEEARTGVVSRAADALPPGAGR
jgi:outer membrane protein TolC